MCPIKGNAMEIIPELLQQEVKSIAPGEVLIKAGDLDRTAYYIVEGSFKIIMAIERSGEEIYHGRPGEWIGEIALILKTPRTATVVAVEPSAVVSLSPELLASFSELSQLKIYRKLSELAAQRIGELNEVLVKANRQINSDLKAAARFLQSLIPDPIKEGPVRTDWLFAPCMHLGGDALGYGWLDRNLFSLYLLDVCGHGAKSALLASTILNVLRTGGIQGVDFSSPSQVLTGLNNTFPMEDYDDTYFSIWYGVYDKRKHQLHYSNAGHPPAILYDSQTITDGIVHNLGIPEPAIGISPDSKYNMQMFNISTGCRILLYSDGVSEIQKKDGTIQTFSEFIKRTQRYMKSPHFNLGWILRNAQKVKGNKKMDDDFTLLQVEFL
jgi:phosphoserine phosphatase RsbU/P